MICQSCRERRHGACRGGSWCDCQHRPGTGAEARGEAAAGARAADRDTGAGAGEGGADATPAEPRVNWRRQG
ncbi:hypothetical protein [Actinomadura fibrosa]|uniref:Uncharacterized protein n=1 Tax=Actinomadura fibrosa TaxID=111802 RepID=A0ABW2Y2M9_9ACTN|nr:hypothetical protein [Actinomadura fibrosa]